ncbi:MAG: diphosphate--fructose-6-phosphate 1-phosphotransferase [Thermodesulfovibrionales bacterium]|nr:diphosphate--fructose-6-phosphate 1-phosphotransferase [Thermodesulfovibrionales bacterium]
MAAKSKAKEVLAIVVGGGPAPGINGVISAATIEAVNEGKQVIGIMGGFKSLFNGDKKAAIPLGIDDVTRIHARGGSILKTSRDYPDKVKEKFKVLMSTLKALKIRYLLTVGGDGTLYMAKWIEREARGSIAVIHVPKTIDNDLPLPGGAPTFGFETARHWGVAILENIMEDARTTSRWYFITTMGRYTGHLALGIGKAAGANITLIPEEFTGEKLSFRTVADILEGSIIKRLAVKKHYGVAVLAEGISSKFDITELSHYEQIEKDETGRVRLSEIQLGRLIRNIVRGSLKEKGIEMTIVDKNIGYELRAANPIPFDAEYTRNLGFGAVRFLLLGGTGAMIVFYEGRLKPVPFVEMTDPATGRTRLRYMDTSSETYMVARKYMMRLEKEDFSGVQIKKLAHAANMTEKEFKKRFYYLVEESGKCPGSAF